MKKYVPLFLIVILILGVNPVLAQSEATLDVKLRRVFGYDSGFLKQPHEIQGTFNLAANGSSTINRVVFLIDSKSMGEATQAPFQLQFSTDSYALGSHTINAVGYTSDGSELKSADITVTFVTASTGMQAGFKIALPILGVLAAVMLLSFLVPIIMGGRKQALPPGASRKYGAAGGTICPRCERPYALHFFAFHLGLSKLDRCPYCGKWAMVRPKPMSELRAAESSELEKAQETGLVPEPSEDEKLRKEIDDSRFQGM